MRLRIEVDPECTEEVVIRARGMNDEILRVRNAIESVLSDSGEISVKKPGGTSYIKLRDVLFFETGDSRVWAHTDRECFECPMTLSELSLKLPVSFEKASKSSIVNTSLIRSLVRSPTGIGTASFERSSKKVFISRMYFKSVRGKIEETRLK